VVVKDSPTTVELPSNLPIKFRKCWTTPGKGIEQPIEVPTKPLPFSKRWAPIGMTQEFIDPVLDVGNGFWGERDTPFVSINPKPNNFE